MLTEKLPLEAYVRLYGPVPSHLNIPGCTIVRREYPLTNEAELSVELPDGPPTVSGVQ